MNQILFTNNNNNNNNYDKVDTKNVIRIFCIAIIIVVILIIGIKIYGFYMNNKGKANAVIPEISVNRNEGTKEVTIKATCEEGIQYLVYIWNNESENKVNLNGSTSFERIVEIPDNTMNKLTVEAVSTKGVKNNKTEIYENSVDNVKPTIDSVAIVDKKLHIDISDDRGIQYLTYQWENEEEIQIPADENDNKTMKVELDIQRGTYKLFVKVVDIDGNEESLSRLITGVNEPEIAVVKYGGLIKVSATHDRGFKRIEYIINDTKYVYDENFSRYDKNKTTVEIDLPLEEGENIVQVNAYSLERLTDEEGEELEKYSFKRFTGKCTYEP